MPQMNMIQALNSAMDIMLARDPNVVMLGEDIGYFGGVFRVTDGLQRKYGEHRVLDTPIAEGAIVGAAIGMGVNGLRPVAEVQFADYIYPACDQIFSELARLRYRSAGDFWAPVTIRTPCGGGIRGGQTHSQSPEGIFTHVCGIKVVMPSTPYDAKGLLIASIEDDDPVVFFEPKRVYRSHREHIPEEEYTIPLGVAKVQREGTDVPIVALARMVQVALQAAETARRTFEEGADGKGGFGLLHLGQSAGGVGTFGDMVDDVTVGAALDHLEVAADAGTDIIQRDGGLFEAVAGAEDGAQLEDQEDRDPGKDEELDQGPVH